MLLNHIKTNSMQFFPDTLDTIEFNIYIINSTNSIKFLDMVTESSLTWKEHLDYINSKLNPLGYMARSLRPV
jgi:hypothetical protein